MKNSALIVLILCSHYFLYGQKQKDKPYYVCFQPTGEYHKNEHCSRLQMCSGGRTKRITKVDGLNPCRKCIKPTTASEKRVESEKKISSNDHNGFADIKRVLGVKDRKQIPDSLGTEAATIHRPQGFTLRITGQAGNKTVNAIDFTFDNPVAFHEDTLFSQQLFDKLGLKFNGCKSDTAREEQNSIRITYKGCALVEPRDQYEDTSTYFYELVFIARENELPLKLDRIKLLLRYEGDK